MTKRKAETQGGRGFTKRLREFRYKFSGNYCGPGWSNGMYQDSVAAGTAPTVDKLDQLCKKHDEAYGQQLNRAKADFNFAFAAARNAVTPPNSPYKMMESLGAAIAVGAQGLGRKLGIVSDERQPRIRGRSDPVQIVGAPSPHFFPILMLKKYAKRRRATKRATSRRKRRSYGRKRKYNKKSRTYRSRRNTRRRTKRTSNTVSFVTEYGQTTSDLQIVYVGHGTTVNGILRTLAQTIVKSLFNKHGNYFVSFEEVILLDVATDDTFGAQVLIKYQGEAKDTALTNKFFDLSNTTTYGGLALSVQRFIEDESWGQQSPIILQSAELLLTDNLFTKKNMVLSKIDLHRANVRWNFSSSIRMQNRTAAGASATGTDINNVNPLEARVYIGKYGQNYFEPYWKAETTEANWKPWVPFSNYGAFSDTFSNHSEVSWKELASAGQTGALKTKKFAIHPGQVVIDSIGAKGFISVNNLIKKVFPAALVEGSTVSVENPLMRMGVARAYGFDKLIWDRTEANLVLIGFEVNQKYSMSLSFKTTKTMPITDVYQP